MALTALYRTYLARTKLYPLIPLQGSLIPQARNPLFRPFHRSDIFPNVFGKSLPLTVCCQNNLTGLYDFPVANFPSLKSTSWKT